MIVLKFIYNFSESSKSRNLGYFFSYKLNVEVKTGSEEEKFSKSKK